MIKFFRKFLGIESPSDLDFWRGKPNVDLVALVSKHVPLKKVGRRYRGLCPFHPEKTPSFHVDESKGLFYCFGCQAGGNATKFMDLIDQISTYPNFKRDEDYGPRPM